MPPATIQRRVSSAFREWSEVRRFNSLEPDQRSIVFYAEDVDSWCHFEPIISCLTGEMNRQVCYLTSSHSESAVERLLPPTRLFRIGDRAARTWLFLRLRADVLVMTMPDLESFHIKRSRVHPVHYVYVFHSMVSTHMAYRRGAFNHFDSLLCAGPHHVQEMRETFTKDRLKPKSLVECGHGRLDTIRDRRPSRERICLHNRNRKPCVLVAPSWGDECLLESCGEDLCRILLGAGYRVVVRPHPMTRRRTPEIIRTLGETFRANSDLIIEHDIRSLDSYDKADVMVSDWSGAALEYAFGLERPVLFVDVPRKVNNPGYANVSTEPLEVTIRREVGDVISPRHLVELPGRIEMLRVEADRLRMQIQRVRSRAVYNLGYSGKVGAEWIGRIADEAAANTSDHP